MSLRAPSIRNLRRGDLGQVLMLWMKGNQSYTKGPSVTPLTEHDAEGLDI
jgi:hypothetical protein